jgi:hypothetical protein
LDGLSYHHRDSVRQQIIFHERSDESQFITGIGRRLAAAIT